MKDIAATSFATLFATIGPLEVASVFALLTGRTSAHLRRGFGVPRPDGSRGDAYIMLKVMLPNGRDPDLEAFAADWAAGKAHNPRLGMEI